MVDSASLAVAFGVLLLLFYWAKQSTLPEPLSRGIHGYKDYRIQKGCMCDHRVYPTNIYALRHLKYLRQHDNNIIFHGIKKGLQRNVNTFNLLYDSLVNGTYSPQAVNESSSLWHLSFRWPLKSCMIESD